jgi:hypothetical protein
MKDKIMKMLATILSIPLKLISKVLAIVTGVMKTFIRSTIFIIIVLIIGLSIGFLVGARLFETGNVGKVGSSLKGTTVKVTGPCRTDGEIRNPALAEDEVKIVSIDEKLMIGVLRGTRETVECDLDRTAIDYLPLLKDLNHSPSEIPELKRNEVVKNDSELDQLKKRTIKVSGTCEDSQGLEMQPLIDQSIDVINLERLSTDHAVIKISGIMKKTKASVTCLSKNIKYSILDNNGDVQVIQGQLTPVKKDLVNSVILITSTCFPDKRLPQTKNSKILFYPVINAKLQVTQNSFDEDGKLVYVAGALIGTGAMVECDTNKYPISWVSYDASSMRLDTIKGSAATDEKANGSATAVEAEEAPQNK